MYGVKIIISFYFSLFFFSAQANNEVPFDAKSVHPIKVGENLPKLILKDIEGDAFDLNKAVSAKRTILVFYRGSWCPYCNVHLGELQTVQESLQQLGYQIIAVSPDRPQNLRTSVEKNTLQYRLVSDSQARAAKALGLAFKVDDATYARYVEDYGIDLESASGEKHHLLPVPAAIVLDTGGQVRFVFSSPNYKVRVNTEELLTAAEAALSG